MYLSKLKKQKQITSSKRVGRGYGSGKGGHTVGKGMKGQGSRSGKGIPFGFEGGQVPLYKKMPKIGGFKNKNTKEIVGVSISKLNLFENNTEVTPKDLVTKNIISKLPKHGVKLIGNSEVSKKLTLTGFIYSNSAQQKLESAGCTINS